MNSKLKKLAEQAGFIIWADEPWKPPGAVIDWSSNYDKDFKIFCELLIRECAKEGKGFYIQGGGTVEEVILSKFKLSP